MAKRVAAGWVQRRLEEGGVALLNVLGPDAFAQGHIPGSVNAPVEEEGFEEKAHQAVPDRTQPVIVYCASTECQASPKAARKLEAQGYSKVYDFKAGMEGWRKAGLPVEGTPQRIPLEQVEASDEEGTAAADA